MALSFLFSSLIIQENSKSFKIVSSQHTMHKNIAINTFTKKKFTKDFCNIQYYSTADVDKAVTCIPL